MEECPKCGIHTKNGVKIKEFKSGEVLEVCIDCSHHIRNQNLMFSE